MKRMERRLCVDAAERTDRVYTVIADASKRRASPPGRCSLGVFGRVEVVEVFALLLAEDVERRCAAVAG